MDKTMQNKFRQVLMQEREEALKSIQHMEEGAMEVSIQDSISELSMYDNHPADVASEMFERSKDLALRDQAELHLAKIDDALKKMESGSYGICDACGAEIPIERLEAMPETTMCVKCKDKEEQLRDRHPRPIEEDVIAPPYGGFTHDHSPHQLYDAADENEFDGEDSWQAVGRYGTSESPQDISVHGVNDFNHMYLDSDENQGPVESVEEIAYEKGLDGVFYKDFDGEDDETIHSREKKGSQKNSHL